MIMMMMCFQNIFSCRIMIVSRIMIVEGLDVFNRFFSTLSELNNIQGMEKVSLLALKLVLNLSLHPSD